MVNGERYYYFKGNKILVKVYEGTKEDLDRVLVGNCFESEQQAINSLADLNE